MSAALHLLRRWRPPYLRRKPLRSGLSVTHTLNTINVGGATRLSTTVINRLQLTVRYPN
eukprot:COSAG06_NODE_54262_length_295_cov_1.219388_1_plen_58_part_10